MNLSEADRARGLPNHDREHIGIHQHDQHRRDILACRQWSLVRTVQAKLNDKVLLSGAEGLGPEDHRKSLPVRPAVHNRTLVVRNREIKTLAAGETERDGLGGVAKAQSRGQERGCCRGAHRGHHVHGVDGVVQRDAEAQFGCGIHRHTPDAGVDQLPRSIGWTSGGLRAERQSDARQEGLLHDADLKHTGVGNLERGIERSERTLVRGARGTRPWRLGSRYRGDL